jgi:excisionase family DNA binding protein
MTERGLLSAKELSLYLGVSPCSVYRLVEKGELPSIRGKGLRIRFKKEDIDSWLETRKSRLHQTPPLFESSLNVEFDLKSYDKLYLKGGNTMKSEGRRWTYPFGSVYVRPSRSGKERWYIYYRAESRKYVREAVKGAASRADALKVLQQKVTEIFQDSNGMKKPKARITFSDLAATYLANTSHLKSWKTNKSRLDHSLLPFFGKLYLDEVTPQHIEEYRSARLKKKSKPITTNRELALLKGMFTKAIDYGYVAANPVKKVKMIPEGDCARERILTPEEEERLIANSIPHFKPFLVIALNTGMRRGEILKLAWPQVDFRNRLVHVVKTKRNKNRVVPMNNALYTTLQGLRAEAKGSERVYQSKHVEGVFATARKNAGLDGLRLHDLRHTFATRLIQAGVDVFTVQKLLGHSTITMTMRYVHSFEAQMRDAVAQLDKKFAQSLLNFQPGPSPVPEACQVTQAGSVN